MVTDIPELVIDTNVFMHASNDICEYNSSSSQLMSFMRESNTFLCVDDVFNTDEAKNTSWIGSEYNNYLVPGTIGYLTLLTIISSGRIKQYVKKNYSTHKRSITRFIKDKTDVVFVCIACATPDKTLISNDFEDLTKRNRKLIAERLNVNTITSHMAIA